MVNVMNISFRKNIFSSHSQSQFGTNVRNFKYFVTMETEMASETLDFCS
jgi:hypothetical protein